MPFNERIVLLFCHGGSFNKESWEPIIRRVEAAPLLQRVPHQVVAIDWRYHGAKATNKDPATLYYENGDQSQPRVEHPGKHWTKWTPGDLYALTKMLRNEDVAMNRKTLIVGVGHSMGAATLMKVEIMHPGTFSGLVLFEPPCILSNEPMVASEQASLMVKRTLEREEEWDTWEDVLNHFKTGKPYRRWHPESLAAFLKGGIKKRHDGKKYRLAMPLIQEASLYCHEIMNYSLDDFARVQCPVVFEYGSQTQLFNLPVIEEVVHAHSSKYKLAEPLEGTTHLTVIEDPDNCADHIIRNLEAFPVFQRAQQASSKL